MYRFYRPRRAAGIGNGLPLDGVSAQFGLFAGIILLLIGLGIFYAKERIAVSDVQAVGVQLTAVPYMGKKANAYYIPITQSRLLVVEGNALLAADTAQLSVLQKGDSLLAFIQWKDAIAWQNGKSPRINTPVYWLQNQQSKQWLISIDGYKQAERTHGNIGLWIAIFAIILLVHQVWRNAPWPIWVSLLLFVLAILFVNSFH